MGGTKFLLRVVLTVLLVTAAMHSMYGQICPLIEKRNNGNGRANFCAGVGSTPMASNFIGTPYAATHEGLEKTGDIEFVFEGTVSAPPAIRRIWIGNTPATAVAGPASVPVASGENTVVTYCFYIQNLPPAGTFTLEFVDPQTDDLMSLCGYSGSSNTSVTPPVIKSQPVSQTTCDGGMATFSVSVQSSNSGSFAYQWSKNGVEIPGATASKVTLSNVSIEDDLSGYSCLIGESTGSFVVSDTATLHVISCANNQYHNTCGSGGVVTTTTNSWNAAWVDYDDDGWENLFVIDKDEASVNSLYKNNGNKNFVLVNNSSPITTAAKTTSSAWADIDNDGDLDVLITNATGKKSLLYINNGNGAFTSADSSGIDNQPQYFHGAAWADFDNDGYVDLLITNFFETRFHHLYRNNRNGTFSHITNTPVTLESHRSLAPILFGLRPGWPYRYIYPEWQ